MNHQSYFDNSTSPLTSWRTQAVWRFWCTWAKLACLSKRELNFSWPHQKAKRFHGDHVERDVLKMPVKRGNVPEIWFHSFFMAFGAGWQQVQSKHNKVKLLTIIDFPFITTNTSQDVKKHLDLWHFNKLMISCFLGRLHVDCSYDLPSDSNNYYITTPGQRHDSSLQL